METNRRTRSKSTQLHLILLVEIWMEMKIIMLDKICQTQKDKTVHVFAYIYTYTNIHITHTEILTPRDIYTQDKKEN